MSAPLYFSETITIGPHTYLMEVKRSKRGQKYFTIKQTSAREDEQQAVVVFRSYMARFSKMIERATKAVLENVPEVETIEVRKVKKQRAAEARKDQLPNQGKRWTGAQDALLTEHYRQGASMDELAQLLGRRRFAIEVRISKLGLER